VADPDAVPALHPGAPPPPDGSPVVDWITRSTRRDRTVISAIPPDFARYATVVVPGDDSAKARADTALVEVLQAHTPEQP
jgi:putative intracellular protease/amidase